MTRDFPDDLVLGILERLPMKSVVRFRCLSKSWGTLLSPDFIYKNLVSTWDDEQHEYPHLLVKHRDVTTKKFVSSLLSRDTLHVSVTTEMPMPLRAKEGPSICFIVDRCRNGIICFVVDYNEGQEDYLVLWNPATDETKFVPRPPAMEWSFFDGLVNDGMVVDICRLRFDACRYLYQVYSMNSHSWRASTPFNHAVRRLDNLFFPGTSIALCSEAVIMGEGLIMYLDVNSEVCRVTSLPDDCIGPGNHACMTLNKSVFIITCDGNEETKQKSVQVWILFEHGVKESWTKLFTIAAPPGVEKVLGFRSNGEIFFQTSGGRLLLYNPLTQEFSQVEIAGLPGSDFQVIPYMATQVSLR